MLDTVEEEEVAANVQLWTLTLKVLLMSRANVALGSCEEECVRISYVFPLPGVSLSLYVCLCV